MLKKKVWNKGIKSLLDQIMEKLRPKPAQLIPGKSMRSPLDGLFIISSTGIPIIFYRERS
jgi:hypothetical protein